MRRGAAARLLLLAGGLLAAAPAPDPQTALRDALSRVQAVIGAQDSRREKLAQLHAVAVELLDTRTMGRIAMGPALQEQPPRLQEEFLRLFDDFAVQAWLQKLLLFREPRFAYPGQRIEGGRALVHTRILTETDSFEIDYEMRRRGDHWLVTDIVVEGVSQNRSYRSQFHRLLEQLSFEGVLEKMRRKIDVLKEAGP